MDSTNKSMKDMKDTSSMNRMINDDDMDKWIESMTPAVKRARTGAHTSTTTRRGTDSFNDGVINNKKSGRHRHTRAGNRNNNHTNGKLANINGPISQCKTESHPQLSGQVRVNPSNNTTKETRTIPPSIATTGTGRAPASTKTTTTTIVNNNINSINSCSVEMSFGISNQSIFVSFDCLKFKNELQLDARLMEQLKYGDYLAMNSIINKMYCLIEQSICKIGNSPYQSIIKLSRGNGDDGRNINANFSGSGASGASGGYGSGKDGINIRNGDRDDEKKQNLNHNNYNNYNNTNGSKNKRKNKSNDISDSEEESEEEEEDDDLTTNMKQNSNSNVNVHVNVNDDFNQINRLRDICICRGISNCSGECGNALIQGAILFYMSIINGELDIKHFNKLTNGAKHEEDMWIKLMKIFDTNEKEEWLIDLMCLIDLMKELLPGMMKSKWFDPFAKYTDSLTKTTKGKSKNSSNSNSDNTFAKLSVLFNQMRQPARKNRIRKWINQMFEQLGKQFKSSHGIDNQTEECTKYILNRLLHLVCFYNYGMDKNTNDSDYYGILIKPIVGKINPRMNYNGANSSDGNDKTNVNILSQFTQNAQQQFLIASMQQVGIVEGSDLSNFNVNVLRLIILINYFLVECQTRFDLNIKCIENYTYSLDQIIEKFHDDKDVKNITQDVQQVFNCARNRMIRLTMDMIAALRLSTIEVINQDMKHAIHLKGDSCRYRDMCGLMLQGLTRLKRYDHKFDTDNCQLYCGMENVTDGDSDSKDDNNNQSCVAPLLSIRNLNNTSIDKENFEYYRLWHGFVSTSQDIQFAESQSVIFKIVGSNDQAPQDLLFGDISWISVNKSEKEVLLGPCLVDITTVQDDSDDENTSQNCNSNCSSSRAQWFNIRPKPVQPVRSLLTSMGTCDDDNDTKLDAIDMDFNMMHINVQQNTDNSVSANATNLGQLDIDDDMFNID